MAKKATTDTTPATDLATQLTQKRVELIEAKRSHAGGELVNPRALGKIRKEIARLETAAKQAAIKEQKESK